MRIKRIAPEREKPAEESVDLRLIDGIIEKFKDKKGNLIPLLQAAQNIYGYIPKSVFLKISESTNLKLSDMYGVATFYAQFRLKPVGKHIIKVCHGTACHVQNANSITDSVQEALGIKDGETTADMKATLESVRCVGACALGPMVIIGEDYHPEMTPDNVCSVLQSYT